MEIKFKNVAKRYEGNVGYTLENINFEIKSGEFVALLGPSGCGKTTLLRMIAGLNSITKGDLIFGNIRVNELEPKDRNIAMVFQSYALYPHMTVYKNIAYSLQVKKVKKEIIDERVKSVAKILQIEHLLFNKPSEISGGQRQRVALGRAIARKPAIFLMDEPLSNLDAKLRESMRVELVKIHKMLNTTTVYVTHDQLEAMTMADKIILLNNQKIQQIGSPSELYNRPQNLFVANFIGSPSMNIIRVKKNQELDSWVLEDSGMPLSFSSSVKKTIDQYQTHDIVLGIRTEDLELALTKPKSKPSIEARVITSELLGKETIVSAEYKIDAKIQVTVPGQVKYELGDRVYVILNEEKLNIFDKKSTLRLN